MEIFDKIGETLRRRWEEENKKLKRRKRKKRERRGGGGPKTNSFFKEFGQDLHCLTVLLESYGLDGLSAAATLIVSHISQSLRASSLSFCLVGLAGAKSQILLLRQVI